jgi:hypothetical protein
MPYMALKVLMMLSYHGILIIIQKILPTILKLDKDPPTLSNSFRIYINLEYTYS